MKQAAKGDCKREPHRKSAILCIAQEAGIPDRLDGQGEQLRLLREGGRQPCRSISRPG
ncbi:MAG: hypothetical protein K5878_19345 [Rhizobiaceae bacterium]|nr:hypothetical protein [Rhizobiaceae bacterium]